MKYAAPMLLLACTVIAFFSVARGRYAQFGIPQFLLRIAVALPLLISGLFLHFLQTDVCAGMIPPSFPHRHLLALLTGALEILGAIGLLVPLTRRMAALWIAILLVAVFPANVYVTGQQINGLHMPSIPIRLTMQVVYLLLTLVSGYGLPGIVSGKSGSISNL